MRLNLLTKILLWVFINLLVLGVVLYFIFNLQFNFAPGSPLLGAMNERIEIIAEMIANESTEMSRVERDEILRKYSDIYGVEFSLFANTGEQLGGKTLELPYQIRESLGRKFEPPSGLPANIKLPPPPRRVHIERTTSPTVYWAIARIPVFEKGIGKAIPGSVIASSNSLTGNGLFFNPTPWIILALIILGLSAAIWFPFIWNLNRSISRLTTATEQIANENFSIRVDDKRRDEVGRLGSSVNHLAEKLSDFVHGQKRFLGDISHELNSPLARMNWALSLLENKTDEADQKYVENVREEVELMTKLVDELLSFAKAGMRSKEVELESVGLRQFVDEVIDREKFSEGRIINGIGKDINVLGNRSFLSKAFANVLRNSIHYGGKEGVITLRSDKVKQTVHVKIADSGEGVPESDISRIFEPLYRVHEDRARLSGGTGLGLAIVKACIEACDGKVAARNIPTGGFEIEFVLRSTSDQSVPPSES